MDVFASLLSILIVVSAFIHSTEAQFKCTHKNGIYEDPIQCDKYYVCADGVATEKICPDGLVFDPLSRKVNRCDQPFNVDCGDRLELQEPKGSYNCPRKNGYFAHPEEKICNVFFNCIEGDATQITCPTGLHFDEYAGTCVWPVSAGRTGCEEPESMKLKDGFSCPKNTPQNTHGQVVAHPVYPHPKDCQKFYVCLNGVTPREQGCPVGEVYNPDVNKCDEPENVADCQDWYKDDPQVQKGKKNKSRK